MKARVAGLMAGLKAWLAPRENAAQQLHYSEQFAHLLEGSGLTGCAAVQGRLVRTML